MQEMLDPSTTLADRGPLEVEMKRDKDGVLRVLKKTSGARGELKIEAKGMTTKNVKKMVKHDCASHVMHEKWGRGECIPEMHTIVETSDGEGYVTHYDVMFGHGIEQNVPVESLVIEKKQMHEHAVHEALVGDQHKIDKNKNNKIDAHDFKLLKAKKKMMESLKATKPPARVEESVDHEELLNSLYDSLSEDNKQKFLDKLETEEGYDAMVQFAREQGF